ncbi:MAG: amidohydrolase family protein [Bacteroidetes bacterium]|nr:amidohydrolase family protein [Bacteroidota bacterium]
MKKLLPAVLLLILIRPALSQDYILKPDRVFDGQSMHEGWEVAVTGDRISYVGSEALINAGVSPEIIELTGMTLSPGLIEGHSHVLLHPYDEASWNDQVLKESRTERVARATNHVRNTVLAGFTTIRDLGSEGADYADVGIKRSIEKGIIVGPRMLVAGRALVATGSYGPKGFHPDFEVPLGAEPADGVDALIRATRDQIGKGADLIKIYADYRWGPNGEAMPTYSVNEIKLIVETATASGRPVVAHAATAQGMTNAILGGVETIEHGDGASDEVFALMKERGVVWYPTLAAVEAISSYAGWRKGIDPDPPRIVQKKASFLRALDSGIRIGLGSDVGVFTHGENAWELELLVEYGMTPLEAMRAATSVNAEVFHLPDLGMIRFGMLADLVAMRGDPTTDIGATRNIEWVMKSGRILKRPH